MWRVREAPAEHMENGKEGVLGCTHAAKADYLQQGVQQLRIEAPDFGHAHLSHHFDSLFVCSFVQSLMRFW